MSTSTLTKWRPQWPMFPETFNLTELAESIDDALFQRIMHVHVLAP